MVSCQVMCFTVYYTSICPVFFDKILFTQVYFGVSTLLEASSGDESKTSDEKEEVHFFLYESDMTSLMEQEFYVQISFFHD